MSKPSKRAETDATEPSTISVTDAARSFSDVINRIKYRGEHFLLTKGGLPVAELRPVAAARIVTARVLAGRLTGLPHLGPEAASRFAEDIEKARARMGSLGSGPWD